MTNLVLHAAMLTNLFTTPPNLFYRPMPTNSQTTVEMNGFKGDMHRATFTWTNLTITTKYAPQILASNDWWIIELKEQTIPSHTMEK